MATEQRANCFLGTWAKFDPVAKMVVHPDPGGRFQRQNNECPFCIVKRAGKSLQRTLDKNGQKSLPNWLILWIHWNYIDVSKITSFSENSIILGGAQGQLTQEEGFNAKTTSVLFVLLKGPKRASEGHSIRMAKSHFLNGWSFEFIETTLMYLR